MAKKKAPKPKSDDGGTDVEQRVKQLMDPAVPDPVKKAESVTIAIKHHDDTPADDVPSAPELKPELPVPKEPLKIKILGHEDDDVGVKAKKSEAKVKKEPVTEPAAEASSDKAEITEEFPESTDDSEVMEAPSLDKTESKDDDADAAVDDIIKHESDELIKAEDDKLEAAFRPQPKRGLGRRIGHFFASWWRNPKARWATIMIVLLAVAAVAVVPDSRYYALNSAGVRGSMSVQVQDESTFQPLRGVTISAGGVSAQTDAQGFARLEKVRLGPTELKIEKRAFARVTKNVVIGWGSNPLGDMSLKPVGTQYLFSVADYLSGKGIEKVEATSNDASAFSDTEGKIKLTLDEPPDQIEVVLQREGYRAEKQTINADDASEHAVQIVPARKHVFVSKRAGKYDVYKVDLDGKNEELVLAGSGSEREDMVLVPHPNKDVIALVSTRDNKHNGDGYLLSTLTVINLAEKNAKAVVSSERVQLVDWAGDRLIYVQVAEGESAVSPKRHRLMSYDIRNSDDRELAASNYFNDVMVAGGKLYYAPSSTYQPAGVGTNVYRSDADGSGKQIVLAKEAWNFFRTAYDHIILSVPGEWYDYQLGGAGTLTKLDGEPANLASRVYIDSPDGKKSLWVDTRDGKGVLLAYEPSSQKEDILRTQSGLKNPISWLGTQAIIYRSKTDQETADYAISPTGGEPKKIRDVTNVGGLDQWYYY
jgi:hypothetical protein